MLKCHPTNTEYLLGISRIVGLHGKVAAAVDAALQDYPGLYEESISGGNEEIGPVAGAPSVAIVAIPSGRHNQPTRFELKHCVDAYENMQGGLDDGGIPRLIFSKLDADHKLVHQSIAHLSAILSNVGPLEGTYTVYSHTLSDRASDPKTYIGITKQGWTARYRQHLAASKSGSPYRFHEALRAHGIVEIHNVFGLGLGFEEAMNLEERLVDQYSLYPLRPNGLNMIPGGFAGIRYLHKLGLQNITPRQIEHRSALVRQVIKRSAREGRPSPWLNAMWRSDDFAASVICKNPNNFDVDRVRQVRLLSGLGVSPEKIADRLSCRPERVNRLIRGNTYGRVH